MDSNFEVLRVYFYHPETKEYVATQDIVVDRSSAFKLPPYSTDIAVPDESEWGDNTAPVYDKVSNLWSIVSDYRSTPYYDKDTGEEVHYKLGEAPDNDRVTVKKPHHPSMVWNDDLNDWELSLDAQKYVKNKLLEAAFLEARDTPIDINNGKEVFSVDPDKILVAYDGSEDDEVIIRDINGAEMILSKDELKNAAMSVNRLRWEAIQKLWSLQDKVDKATKPAELAVINWVG